MTIRVLLPRRSGMFAALVVGSLLVTSATAAARRAGTPDVLFGTGGVTHASLGGDVHVSRLARQPDGSLVAACEIWRQVGSANRPHFGLAHFRPNGELDTGFGVSGVQLTDFGDLSDPAQQASASSVQVDGQGRILAAGSVSQPFTSQFVLTRHLADGSLDGSFGVSGKVVGTSGALSSLSALALQRDGAIVAAGSSTLGGDQSIFLVRYLANGKPDPDFGANGRVVTVLGNSSEASSVVIRPNGKIVVGGIVGEDACALQYRSDGTLDPSFGRNGVIQVDTLDGEDRFSQIALQRDGRLVAGGGSYAREGNEFVQRPILVRFTTRGKIDRSFGTRGLVRGRAGGYFQDLAIQTNGRIATAGLDADRFTVSRFTPAGKPDRSFGIDGVSIVPASEPAQSEALLLEPEGKIVAAGRAEVDGQSEAELLVTRIWAR